MTRRPVLGHVFGRYLPYSEVFLHELLDSLTAFEHRIFAGGLENLDRFPHPHLITPRTPEEYWTRARQEGVELVVSHFGPHGNTGMPIALVNAVPAVTMFYGYDVSTILRDPAWVERYRSLAALGMFGVSNSEAGRQRLEDIGWPAAQLATIHLGVDVRRFAFTPRRQRTPGAPLRLLMLARLVAKKGIDVAIRAVAALQQAGVTAELRVVGEGPDRPALEQLVATLGVGKSVALAGSQLHATMAAELEAADIYLQCSVTAPNGDQEGLPVALTEAQASGVPAIATRHAGIPELIVDGETGLLVGEHDVRGLADAIVILANDPRRAAAMARAGRQRVEQEFDLRGQARRFSTLFESLIERGPWTAASRRTADRRLLFIRSVPVTVALRKLMLLRFRYPNASITVLTTRSTAEMFRACPLVSAVETYDEGRIGLRRLGRPLLESLQREGFDLVVAPYTNGDGQGFGNVRRVARACGGRRRVALTDADVEMELAGCVRPSVVPALVLEGQRG